MQPGWSDMQQATLVALTAQFGGDFAESLRRMMEETKQLFTSKVMVKDNLFAAIVKIPTCKHGKMKKFKNPLYPTVPLFFTPFATQEKNGADALPLSGQPILNTKLGEGFLGLTPYYAPPYGICDVRRDAAQSLANGNDQLIQFDARNISTPNLSWVSGDPTKITCKAGGWLQLSYQTGWATNATGVRSCSVWLNGVGTSRVGTQQVQAASTATRDTGLSGAAMKSVSAGDYISLQTFQDSGGALNSTTGANRPRLHAQYVSPPSNYAANVLGVLWGG